MACLYDLDAAPVYTSAQPTRVHGAQDGIAAHTALSLFLFTKKVAYLQHQCPEGAEAQARCFYRELNPDSLRKSDDTEQELSGTDFNGY